MKNKLLVIALLLSLLLVTGCGSKSSGGGGLFNSNKTMTCTKESTDDEGYKVTDTMKVTYNSSKVLKVETTNISETDPTYIDLALSFGQLFAASFNEIDGIDVSYTKEGDNKLKVTTAVEYGKINLEQIKNVLGDLYSEEDSLYGKKDYTIDDFKAENLEGYTCE